MYKTPGVYLKDVTQPRPTLPSLETAVPAFIGYTEKALDAQGRSLHLVPTRIRTLGEMEAYFGGAFQPSSYRVYMDLAKAHRIQRVEIQDRFYLFDSLRHYFDQGGTDAYLVSIGHYAEGLQPAPVAQEPEDDDCRPRPKQPSSSHEGQNQSLLPWHHFQQGVDALMGYDEPTLILFPDAVRFRRASDNTPDDDSLGQLQQYALRHCARRKDRFCLFDLMPGDTLQEELLRFRDAVGSSHLDYGAAYHPWIWTTYEHSFHYRDLSFFDVSSGAPLDAQVALSSSVASESKERYQQLIEDTDEASTEVEALLASANLSRADATRTDLVLDDAARTFRMEASATPPGLDRLTSYQALADLVRGWGLSFYQLDQQVSTPLQQAIEEGIASERLPRQLQTWVAIEKSERAGHRYGAEEAAWQMELLELLSGSRWLGSKKVEDIEALVFPSDEALLSAIIDVGSALSQAMARVVAHALSIEAAWEQRLFVEHPVLQQVVQAIRQEGQKIPPSGTIAGVIVATDAQRGVWKAPANVSLNATLGPVLSIEDRAQEDMNVHETGKAVNAIRSFPGRGAVVWGSRTLLANSLEWRYVPVRRLFLYAETYLRRASESLVFEPNDANTWLRLRNLIDSFLRGLWRKGALYGSTAQEAYFIGIGLGESMTTQDLLEGRMVVEVGLAAARPAEYLLIRYECRMEQQ